MLIPLGIPMLLSRVVPMVFPPPITRTINPLSLIPLTSRLSNCPRDEVSNVVEEDPIKPKTRVVFKNSNLFQILLKLLKIKFGRGKNTTIEVYIN